MCITLTENTMDTILNNLQNTEIFQETGIENIRRIAAICRRYTEPADRMLFFEGDPGRDVFILASGTVRLFKSTHDGREVVMKLIHPGEIFAEVILFEEDTYPVSAVTLGPSEIITIPRQKFIQLLDDAGMRDAFIAGMLKKMRYLTQRIMYLNAYDVEERFFSFIRDNFGEHESYTIPLSRKEIASAIGTIPETFSRLVTRLKKRGILTWDGNTLELAPDFWQTCRLPFDE